MHAGNMPLTAKCSTTVGAIKKHRFGYLNPATKTVTYPNSVSNEDANVIIVGDPYLGAVAVVPLTDVTHRYFIELKADCAVGAGLKAEDGTGLGVVTAVAADILRYADYAGKGGALVGTFKL